MTRDMTKTPLFSTSLLKVGAIISWTAAAALVSGCLAVAPQATITSHTWRPITLKPGEGWQGQTSALYTYVLAGDIGDGGANAAKLRARGALEKLLQEVTANDRSGVGNEPIPQPMLMHLNQFCIPARSRELQAMHFPDYDLALSANYLRWFRMILEKDPQLAKVLSGNGPFLVATREPVHLIAVQGPGDSIKIRSESPVLVMDMSDYSATSVAYFVDGFKKAVGKAPPGNGELTPLKPVIASFILGVAEGIPNVWEAMAGTAKAFNAIKP